LKNVKITFFQQKISFSAGKYERKIPEKIPEFPLYKSSKFFIAITTDEKIIQK